MLREGGETEEQLEERRKKKVAAGACSLLSSFFRAPPCSFPSAFARTPPSPESHTTHALTLIWGPPFYAGINLGLKNAAKHPSIAEQQEARTVKVEILVAELMRNGIEPRSTGPGADAALLERQIAEGKSAAATSGATWL